MTFVQEPEVKWSPDQMVEVLLNEPDDFLKVRETLTRIGVASRKEKKIYQSCHILHKQGRYFLVHFKELFALDGKHANLTQNDIQRRNRIVQLLVDWGLIGIVDVVKIKDIAPLNRASDLLNQLWNHVGIQSGIILKTCWCHAPGSFSSLSLPPCLPLLLTTAPQILKVGGCLS